MKKLLFLLLLSPSALMAQEAYNVEFEGKFLPAQILLGDGTIYSDPLMKYQQPEYYKNPLNRFTISLGSESEAYEAPQGTIIAFKINNTVWAGSTIKPGELVIYSRQGAIEQIWTVNNGEMGSFKKEKIDAVYVILAARTKTITRNTLTNETIEGSPSDEKIKEWIADSPEVMEDLRMAEAYAAAQTKKRDSLNAAGVAKPSSTKKGLLGALEKASIKQTEIKKEAATTVDMGRIINNYNAWYEEHHHGKIKYYFTSTPEWMYLPKVAKTQDEIKAENKAKLENLFAGRTTSVSPELASAKDNTPIKKETFAAKVERISGDGNKVGVLINLKPVRKVVPGAQIGTEVIVEEDAYMDASLNATAESLVQELNQALGISNIELIDINKIPYREVKVLGQQTRVDDWWATKYKVVFAYTLDPRLKTEQTETGKKGKFTAYLNMLASMIVTEYIGNTTATKQDILTQILNMGSFLTPSYSQEEGMTDVKLIYDKTLEKLGTPLLEKIKAERADEMAKVTKKLKD